MSLHSMMAMRLAPGCCLESQSTPASNQVICDAGGKSANNAIHLGRSLMIFVQLPGSRRPGGGKRYRLAAVRTIITGFYQLADLGSNPRSKIFALPVMSDNRLSFLHLDTLN